MKYELAKQLKDAGFPQNGYFWWFAKSIKDHGERNQLWKVVPRGSFQADAQNEKYSCPTLSELIEACGKDFKQLTRWNTGDHWDAVSSLEDALVKTGDGSTPEEAVAKLWLALNKK